MINYKTTPVVVNATKNNLTVDGDALIHRNFKPPKNRAATTNQIKNEPLFEIKGQNLASNYVHKRQNSVSSESRNNLLNDNNSSLTNQRILLPKIISKKSDSEIKDEIDLNENRKNSVKSAFDAFNMAEVIGTKPYQMSRTQNNNESNAFNENNLTINNITSPPVFKGISSKEHNNFLNHTHNESINSYISEEENRLKQLENYSSLLTKNQILLFQNTNENDKKLQNSRKLSLRIHHPQTKMANLIRKNEKTKTLKNKTENFESLQLVAVSAIKPDEYQKNYENQCLNYYPTSESDENDEYD
jgi:hypothetical protein